MRPPHRLDYDTAASDGEGGGVLDLSYLAGLILHHAHVPLDPFFT
jgi:hypothetical protein